MRKLYVVAKKAIGQTVVWPFLKPIDENMDQTTKITFI